MYSTCVYTGILYKVLYKYHDSYRLHTLHTGTQLLNAVDGYSHTFFARWVELSHESIRAQS